MFCKKVGFNRIEVKSSFAPLIELMFTYLNPHDTKKREKKITIVNYNEQNVETMEREDITILV